MQWRSLLPVLLLLLFAQPALAGLRGTVYDVNGKALSRVRIVVQQNNTAPVTLTTNSEGKYLVPRLAPGTYTATFSIEGYEAQCFKPIIIHPASEELLLDARLRKNEGQGKTIATIYYTPRPYLPDGPLDEPIPLSKIPRCGTYLANTLSAYKEESRKRSTTRTFVQGPGIFGVLKDERGEPIPGGSVVVIEGGIVRGGVVTDFDGYYVIKPLDAGRYDVKFSFNGKEQTVTGVRVGYDSASILNHKIVTARDATSGKTVVVKSVRYARPLISPRNPGGQTVRSEAIEIEGLTGATTKPLIDPRSPGGSTIKTAVDIEKASSTNIADIAALPTQAYQSKIGDDLSLGGGRVSGNVYIVDGVQPGSGDGSFAAPSQGAHAGMLTSGEINDFSKWTLWQDLSMDALKTYRNTWQFRPEARYTVLVKSSNDRPLCNARVKLSNGSQVWEAMTDNTGKAELWYGLLGAEAAAIPRSLSASIDYRGRQFTIPSLKPFADGINILSTKLPCLNPVKLDIAFLVDATGSMGDEIDYLKAELRDIIQKVKDSLPALQVQTGAVFYRDLRDTYITRTSDLTANLSETEAFIAANDAGGGGDTPEAVDEALEQGLNALSWRDDAIARLAFLVLDAPPHQDAATVKRMQDLIAQYAARGIRLIPVVCSGSDKSTEYLMRAVALATNGTYLFLTDHSQIGGSHTAPTTDKYDVEYLNGLIYRVIYNCAYMPACDDAPAPTQRDTMQVAQPVKDSAIARWRYYPNPTSGVLHIEHTHTRGYLLITDIIGKAILRLPADESGHTMVDMSQYPSGIYTIRYNWADDQWIGGKFTVVH